MFVAPPALPVRESVSICEILKRPSSYTKRIIHIQSNVILGMPHGAFLQDDSCPRLIILLGKDLPEAASSAENLVPTVLNACSRESGFAPEPGLFTGQLTYSSQGRIEFRLKAVKVQAETCAEIIDKVIKGTLSKPLTSEPSSPAALSPLPPAKPPHRPPPSFR
jgi:hypothetical protein